MAESVQISVGVHRLCSNRMAGSLEGSPLCSWLLAWPLYQWSVSCDKVMRKIIGFLEVRCSMRVSHSAQLMHHADYRRIFIPCHLLQDTLLQMMHKFLHYRHKTLHTSSTQYEKCTSLSSQHGRGKSQHSSVSKIWECLSVSFPWTYTCVCMWATICFYTTARLNT